MGNEDVNKRLGIVVLPSKLSSLDKEGCCFQYILKVNKNCELNQIEILPCNRFNSKEMDVSHSTKGLG